MDLERVSVVIRSRSAWEAFDLGLVLGRRWWKTSVIGIAMVATPVFLIANTVFSSMPLLALAIVWWGKPLYERIPLTIVSRAFFGERGDAYDFLRRSSWPTFGELFGLLTWGRFSGWRSYLAPVEQLEELGGAARRKRASVLGRAHTGGALGLTLVCLLTEFALWASVYAFLAILIPEELGVELTPPDYFEDGSGWPFVLSNGIAFVVQIAVMPFYSAAGFALYIQRRVELEGWDLELAFRRLTRRLRGVRSARSKAS